MTAKKPKADLDQAAKGEDALKRIADDLANIEPASGGKRLSEEEMALEALENGWRPTTPTSLSYTPPKLEK